MIVEAAKTWRRQGWVLVDGLVPADQVAAARAEIKPRDEAAAVASGPTRRSEVDRGARFRQRQFDGTTLFPYPDAPHLNRLFVHPNVVAFAKAALETDDIRIYQSRVWSKYGDHTNYEQSHHLDSNHSLVPIRSDGPWGHLECFLYLHPLDDAGGAPRVAARPVGDTTGTGERLGGPGAGGIAPRADHPDYYEGEVSAVGAAGSLFAYRSDVWHRGVDLAPDVERHLIAVSFRPAEVTWINFDSHGPLASRPDFVSFAEACTPEELALFDVPRPGHPYWTADVLEAMARHYPNLNLTPWRAALG